MTRFLLSMVLGVSAALGLLLPLPLSEGAVVAKTLAQTPVTGRLADGGTFQGRLTLQALRFDEAGELIATGVLSGTATPAVGRTTKVPAHTFTTPVALLDLRGTCRTLVVDLAPLTVAPCAGTHAAARGPGSRDHAQGGAPVADGTLYRGAPPGVAPRSRTAGRNAGARFGEGRVVHQGVFASRSARCLGCKSLPCHPGSACPPSQNERVACCWPL